MCACISSVSFCQKLSIRAHNLKHSCLNELKSRQVKLVSVLLRFHSVAAAHDSLPLPNEPFHAHRDTPGKHPAIPPSSNASSPLACPHSLAAVYERATAVGAPPIQRLDTRRLLVPYYYCAQHGVSSNSL